MPGHGINDNKTQYKISKEFEKQKEEQKEERDKIEKGKLEEATRVYVCGYCSFGCCTVVTTYADPPVQCLYSIDPFPGAWRVPL